MGRIVATIRQALGQGQASEQSYRNKGRTRPEPCTGMAETPKLSLFWGALLRAGLVALLVVLPALVIPSTPPELGQVLLLLGLFAGVIVLAEYTSAYPALIEFRFAAPFNRTRFMLLLLLVLCLSLLQRHVELAGGLAQSVALIASVCGRMFDFPFSPVRQLVAFLPDGTSPAAMMLVRDGASLALVLAMTVVAGFFTAIRMKLWPMGQGPFNVWINLPTFEPTAGNDVVARLQRQARFNISLGLIMPFLLPGLMMASALLIRPLDLTAPISYVWGIALWAFIPSALVMRGIAMGRVAHMIRASRRRLASGTEAGAFASA